MPAPSESPRTLVVVLKRSLWACGGEKYWWVAFESKPTPSVDALRRLLALCICNLCDIGAWRPFEALRWHLVPADPQNPNTGQSPSRWHLMGTHRNQSTAMISVMSSVGSPTDVNTITMVTRPAWGMPAAPMLAAVAVILCGRGERGGRDSRECGERFITGNKQRQQLAGNHKTITTPRKSVCKNHVGSMCCW